MGYRTVTRDRTTMKIASFIGNCAVFVQTPRCLLRVFLLAVMSASPSWSFSCEPEQTTEAAFAEAERVFLVYVTETRLEEDLLERMAAESDEFDFSEEHWKFVSAGYRVVEEFKGDAEYQPRLVDWLGIGTGYVGLVPGGYYTQSLH